MPGARPCHQKRGTELWVNGPPFSKATSHGEQGHCQQRLSAARAPELVSVPSCRHPAPGDCPAPYLHPLPTSPLPALTTRQRLKVFLTQRAEKSFKNRSADHIATQPSFVKFSGGLELTSKLLTVALPHSTQAPRPRVLPASAPAATGSPRGRLFPGLFGPMLQAPVPEAGSPTTPPNGTPSAPFLLPVPPTARPLAPNLCRSARAAPGPLEASDRWRAGRQAEGRQHPLSGRRALSVRRTLCYFILTALGGCTSCPQSWEPSSDEELRPKERECSAWAHAASERSDLQPRELGFQTGLA